jgi:predicted molibdopterin-dependent oxidoreductase YjgC
VLWGSNARNAHPIFFHHVLKGVHNGARLYCVDPRRSESARWADAWLGIDVGTDIPLANAMAREIIHAGLTNREFIGRATTGYEEFAAAVEPWTLERAARVTGVPAEAIRDLAHTYARAGRAQLCWTLGITEHHNASDNVFALINLALLTGHVGRYGSGLVPVRGQNNVQGGGDMGALPNKLPGFQDVADDDKRGKFEALWGTEVPATPGRHLTLMFDGIEEDEIHALYIIGENPAQAEADAGRARRLLDAVDFVVVQDMFLTRTAEIADVVLPAAADWCEAEGTVTSSERRIQRTRMALQPPGDARPDLHIIAALAAELGHDWGIPAVPSSADEAAAVAEGVWDELRSLSPIHAGMAYRRLDEHGGLQWPCYDEDHPGEQFLHARLWDDPVTGDRAPFTPVEHSPPVDELDDEYPLRMTTGRHLDAYNTGVQTDGYTSPLRREGRSGAMVDISPEDVERMGLAAGEIVRVASRRGALEARVNVHDGLRPGLVFMALHYPDETDVNKLTIEAWDPRSGTAEFKATAVRIEKVPQPAPDGAGGDSTTRQPTASQVGA